MRNLWTCRWWPPRRGPAEESRIERSAQVVSHPPKVLPRFPHIGEPLRADPHSTTVFGFLLRNQGINQPFRRADISKMRRYMVGIKCKISRVQAFHICEIAARSARTRRFCRLHRSSSFVQALKFHQCCRCCVCNSQNICASRHILAGC